MKLLVIGANGACGNRIVREANARGHHTTPAGRSPAGPLGGQSGWVTLDAADATAVAAASTGHDVIISATRPGPGREGEILPVTEGLLGGARTAGLRLVVVGGAGPLRVGDTNRTAIEVPHWVPAAYRRSAAASVHQLSTLEASSGVDWTYLAPPALFQPGERTGTYRTGGASLVVAPDGTSSISMEDFAIALLDEVEHPTTSRSVLSVGH
ncbi:NAD(P)-dependent oxidoreductase [Ornithinimicrobium cavernae]|uniref:NAD(P)-dependent oxidoreductase n=1 Tax=Ornithinimicrobium cavernae TaxID=2666047 RepID=UPI000D698361|nr:NAD(P)H-binding protein [Ornithinimicrobium cavernae]